MPDGAGRLVGSGSPLPAATEDGERTGNANLEEDRFRILIVDDEPAIRAGLSRAWQVQTYEVATAADAVEALESVRDARPPHLILQASACPGRSRVST